MSEESKTTTTITSTPNSTPIIATPINDIINNNNVKNVQPIKKSKSSNNIPKLSLADKPELKRDDYVQSSKIKDSKVIPSTATIKGDKPELKRDDYVQSSKIKDSKVIPSTATIKGKYTTPDRIIDDDYFFTRRSRPSFPNVLHDDDDDSEAIDCESLGSKDSEEEEEDNNDDDDDEYENDSFCEVTKPSKKKLKTTNFKITNLIKDLNEHSEAIIRSVEFCIEQQKDFKSQLSKLEPDSKKAMFLEDAHQYTIERQRYKMFQLIDQMKEDINDFF